MAAFHLPMVLGSSSLSGMSPKVGRIRFSTFLRVPYSDAGCWSFRAGHHLVVTYSPTRVRALAGFGSVEWGVAGGRRARAPPLGLRAAQGWVDAGRALVGAVLVADLVALLGVVGEGGTIAIQAITMPPCRRSPDDSRPALGMSSY